jgi:hypothetical protein
MLSMNRVFSFFLRLFLSFLGAKFLLRAVGWDSQDHLIGLTLIFTANVYWFDYLNYRNRISHRLGPRDREASGPPPGGEETS